MIQLAIEIPYWGQSLLRVLGGLVAVLLPAGTIVYLFLFKMMSFMQSRLGPMEAGPYGSLQLVAEVGKWMQKEDIAPDNADRAIFKIAPLVVPPDYREVLQDDDGPREGQTLAALAKTLGATLHSAEVTAGYDPDGGLHEAAHRTMMILKHFDPEIVNAFTAVAEKFNRVRKEKLKEDADFSERPARAVGR